MGWRWRYQILSVLAVDVGVGFITWSVAGVAVLLVLGEAVSLGVWIEEAGELRETTLFCSEEG